MSLTAPLGLLALLAVPAIVALHLFRNRLPEKFVAALFLFPGTAVASDGGRTRTRLLRTPSLWLECLAAALLALWLSGFTLGGMLPRHLVLVLDDSASMAAVATQQRAKEQLQQLCDELSSDDEVSVVLSGKPAQVVVGPRARPPELTAWLPTYWPARRDHPLQGALDLAREVAGHSGEIVCLTDHEPVDPGEDMRVVGCGQAAGNAAIASLQRSLGERQDRLLVKIVAYGEVTSGDVLVTVDGGEPIRVPLQLGAGSDTMQFALPVARDQLRVHVQLPDDALLLDNEAWLLPSAQPIVAVCNRLAPAQSDLLELPRMLAAMTGWREESNERRAQLILRASPGSPAAGQCELVIAASAGPKQAHRSPFVIDRSHALLSGVALEGVAWQSGSAELPGQVLVAAGSKVLLSREVLAAGNRIWCDVDARAGNLVRAPDWPILFANALELARREVPGCLAQNLDVGDELVYRAGEVRQPVSLLGPDGTTLAAAVGDLSAVVAQPGRYAVVTKDARQLAEVAVRFVDVRESDLRRATTFDRLPNRAARRAVAARVDSAPMRRILVALLLLVVSLNWWFLQRRAG